MVQTRSAPAPSLGPLPGPSTTTPPNEITLVCQAVDNEFNIVGGLFPLTISPAVFVHELKVSIKAQKPGGFGHIDADELCLWKPKKPLSIAGGQGIPAVKKLLGRFHKGKSVVSLAQELDPITSVSNYFNEILPLHLNLIAQGAVCGDGESVHICFEHLR